MGENSLVTAIGSFELRRWPLDDNDPLRAWDAADEYLLEQVLAVLPIARGVPLSILVVNDAQGALATVLHEWQPQSWSDSVVSHRAAAENLSRNAIAQPLRAIASSQTPVAPFDLVLIKIPKTTALLDDQLSRLRDLCDVNTQIIAAGMVKHLQKSAFTSLESTIGPLTTSLAKKKARLLFIQKDESLVPAATPYPTSYTDEAIGKPLLNHANVFSREHLDHGSRFLLEHLASIPYADCVVDLACGNGVLGLVYQQRHAQSTVQFVDESYSAIESAKLNHAAWYAETDNPAAFVVGDALEHQADNSVDLVLCNPPFHQQHATGDQVAKRLFVESKRCLSQRGEFWIVANRHLGYDAVLQRLFGNCRTVATNRKFSVYRAVKR